MPLKCVQGGRGVLSQVFLTVFFFHDTAPTEFYTLSLHDALPISRLGAPRIPVGYSMPLEDEARVSSERILDRKSTRLNSSHSQISYAVFCLKKKKKAIHFKPRVGTPEEN